MAEDIAESSINSAVQSTANAAKRLVKEGSRKALEAAANTVVPGSGTIAKKALEMLSRKGQGGGKDNGLKWAAIIGGCLLAFVVLLLTIIFSAFVEVKETVGAIVSGSRTDIGIYKIVGPSQLKVEDLDNDKQTTFTYDIFLTALKSDLSNISIKSDEFTLVKKDGSTIKANLFTNEQIANFNSQMANFTIQQGQRLRLPIQLEITLPYKTFTNDVLKDSSFVINRIVIEARIAGFPKQVSDLAAVYIGDPGCFYFDETWSDINKTNEMSTISRFMDNQKYSRQLCQLNSPPIKLTYQPGEQYSTANRYESTITVTDLCLRKEADRFYCLVHETGHIFDQRYNSTIYARFKALITPPGGQREDFLCSYPIKPSNISEDFAETIAVSLTKKALLTRDYNACPGDIINLNEYPLHKQFAEEWYLD